MFWVTTTDDFGSKNDGNGGGGIEMIMSGGGSIMSMQSMHDIPFTRTQKDVTTFEL